LNEFYLNFATKHKKLIYFNTKS